MPALRKPTVKKNILIHPRTGSEKKIDASTHDAFKKAILQSLKGKQGITFSRLNKEVAILIKQNLPAFKGSVPWYTITVKLDLETKGRVETITEKGQKLNRLRK